MKNIHLLALLATYGFCFLCIPLIQASPRFETTGHDSPAKTLAPPAFGKFRTDPDTGFKVWRLGGSQQEMGNQCPYPEGNEAINLLHAQHFYSRTSPVNADETHVLGSAGQKHHYAALWRLADKKLVTWVPAASEPAHLQQRQLVWDRKQADVYWFTQGRQLWRASIDFKTYQVTTEKWDTFRDFAYITFGFGEGNFSDDGQRLVLAGKDNIDNAVYIQPYDITTKRRWPRRRVADHEESFDWASVDPGGHYIVFARHEPQAVTQVIPFTQAHTAEPRVLLADVKHSDLILDAGGEAWWVYGNWRGLFAVRVADAYTRRVWPVRDSGEAEEAPAGYNASGHIARIPGQPGRVLLSRYQDGGLYKIDATGKAPARYVGNSRHGHGLPYPAHDKSDPKAVRRRGVTREGEVTAYKREARAAVSPSGRHVFFVSDYHVHATDPAGYDPEPEPGEAYLNLIELPAES